MHIFIDESGTFSDFRKGSISAVGALVLPDGQLPTIEKKYAKIRINLPKKNGEVKGKLLNEKQIDAIVTMLTRNMAIFECCFVDLGVLEETEVIDGKNDHSNYLLNLSSTIHPAHKDMVRRAGEFIAKARTNQYLQALATFEVIQGVFYVAPLYFSMRQPKELAEFAWIIDGKNKVKVDEWETWWSGYAPGALSTMSNRRPRPEIAGADFSYLEKYKGITKEKDGTEYEGTNMNLILKNLRFSSQPETGLELVDILVNATRRALVGHLQLGGYQSIRELMLHRKDEGGLRLVGFTSRDDKAGWREVRADWVPTAKYFLKNGRTMFTKNAIQKTWDIEEAEQTKSGALKPP